MEELKAQRDLQYGKIITLTDKMKKAVREKSERILTRSIPELAEAVEKFERIHIALLGKAKKDMNDPEYKEMFDAVQEIAEDSKEAARDCLDSLEESAQELRKIQAKKDEADRSKKKYEAINRVFLEEWENMKAMMSEDIGKLYSGNEDAWKPDTVALAAHVLYYEDRYAKSQNNYQDFADNSGQAVAVQAATAAKYAFEASYRSDLMKIRSAAVTANTGDSRSSSRRSSPERGSKSFRSKKMEFPKFSGSIRQYSSFKRDFQEIVEKPGNFSRKKCHTF